MHKKCVICGNPHKNTMFKTCSQLCQKQHERNLKDIAKAKKQDAKVKEAVKKVRQLDKKRFSRSKLVAEADRVFSIYIRHRDKWIPCITCDAKWEENHQCGHFFSRRHYSTRWMEYNAHSQCPKCNLYWAWEQYLHWLAIDKIYWDWTTRKISGMALSVQKVTDEEILWYIRMYYKLVPEDIIKPKKYYESSTT